MKKTYPLYIVVCLLFIGCKANVLTGEKSLNFFSDNKKLFAMSLQQYETFLNENEVVTGTKDANLVRSIGEDIARAAQIYYNYKGQPNMLNDYNWEYNLVNNEQVNAWCMPGGKIVFYTGIMPIASNPDGIAAIMGHEVAHALSDHGAQRMSLGMVQQAGGIITGEVTKNQDAKKRQKIMMAYGIGTTVGGMLPFSRKHETEADKIGLELMTIAGYNPEEAPKLWERMKAQSKGGQPEFLSTHPSEVRRIANLQSWIPGAKALAKQINATTVTQ
ncbi:MAG: M48 family metallopeptidase [Bacteroidetes bacterium]|nr:M48 family metallopeptidase [Bacteroidota bacterium]MDA0888672.1 M48 family metallopeptidase [Bacteroidota bacterium]MDA1085310.1 M48 family metallopeptidase [Bacteroidota bacterium]